MSRSWNIVRANFYVVYKQSIKIEKVVFGIGMEGTKKKKLKSKCPDLARKDREYFVERMVNFEKWKGLENFLRLIRRTIQTVLRETILV